MFGKKKSSLSSILNSTATKTSYGEWVSYSQNRPIQFQDFDLEFLGTEDNIFYPGTDRRLAPIYKFDASKGDKVSPFSWSEGTGEIAPADFELHGSTYFVEIGNSEILGRPKVVANSDTDNMVVAWPEKEFKRRSR